MRVQWMEIKVKMQWTRQDLISVTIIVEEDLRLQLRKETE